MPSATNHKTEVWSQKDYYGIAAFFDGIESEQKGYIQTMDMAGNEKRMENYLITNEPRKAIWVERLEAEIPPRFLGGTEYEGTLPQETRGTRAVDDG